MERKTFVETMLNETVSTAFEYIDHIEYCECNKDYFGFETVTIVCNNGCRYHANIECDSLGAIIEDVVKEALRH